MQLFFTPIFKLRLFLVQNIPFATSFDNYNIRYSCRVSDQINLDNKISINKIIFTKTATFLIGTKIVFIIYIKLSLTRDCSLWRLLMWKRRRFSVCLSVYSFKVTDRAANQRFLIARINLPFYVQVNWTELRKSHIAMNSDTTKRFSSNIPDGFQQSHIIISRNKPFLDMLRQAT